MKNETQLIAFTLFLGKKFSNFSMNVRIYYWLWKLPYLIADQIFFISEVGNLVITN